MTDDGGCHGVFCCDNDAYHSLHPSTRTPRSMYLGEFKYSDSMIIGNMARAKWPTANSESDGQKKGPVTTAKDAIL